MPNRNYIKGRKKEYKILNHYKKLGMIGYRSAGSHSPIDVTIIDQENKIIKLIQCKPDKFSEKKKAELYDSLKGLQDEYLVIFEVV